MKVPKEIQYTLTKQERKDAKKFIKKHSNCEHLAEQYYVGAIKTTIFSYIIGQNSVASTIKIRCDWCKIEEDISDVSIW